MTGKEVESAIREGYQRHLARQLERRQIQRQHLHEADPARGESGKEIWSIKPLIPMDNPGVIVRQVKHRSTHRAGVQ